MLEDARRMMQDLGDIAQDPDGYMRKYCEAWETLAISAGSEVSQYQHDMESYYADEPAVIWLTGLVMPFRKLWFRAKSNDVIGGLGRALRDQVVAHYGSYAAIPAQYRESFERSMAALDERC